MKRLINNIKSDKITFRGFMLSIVLCVATIIFILLYYRSLPPLIPIFNQLPWGDQRFTDINGVFITSGIFMVIFLINFLYSAFVYTKNPLIARMLAATTLLIAILNFIFIVRTILVII